MVISGTILLGVKIFKVVTTANTIRKIISDEPISYHAAKSISERGSDALGVLIDDDSDNGLFDTVTNAASTLCGI